jgi:hypothetical protein
MCAASVPSMTREQQPQDTGELVRQGVVQLVLLTAALVAVNRHLRDLAWDTALWRSLGFAVPFTLVYTASASYMRRRRDGGS